MHGMVAVEDVCRVKSGVVTLDITGALALVLPKDETFYRTGFEAVGRESVGKVGQGKQ